MENTEDKQEEYPDMEVKQKMVSAIADCKGAILIANFDKGLEIVNFGIGFTETVGMMEMAKSTLIQASTGMRPGAMDRE